MPDYEHWKGIPGSETNLLYMGSLHMMPIGRVEYISRGYWKGWYKTTKVYDGKSRVEAMEEVEKAHAKQIGARYAPVVELKPGDCLGDGEPQFLPLAQRSQRAAEMSTFDKIDLHRKLYWLESRFRQDANHVFPEGARVKFEFQLGMPDQLFVTLTIPPKKDLTMEHISIVINTTHAESLGIIKCAVERNNKVAREELEYEADEEEKAIEDARDWLRERVGDEIAEATEVMHVANTAQE